MDGSAWSNGHCVNVSHAPTSVECLFSMTLVLGMSAKTIQDVVSGKHPFAAAMKEAQQPLIIVGASLLRRPDRDGLLQVGASDCLLAPQTSLHPVRGTGFVREGCSGGGGGGYGGGSG